MNVTVMSLEEVVEVRMEDQGEGIPPEELGVIFDHFYRGRYGNRASGLGLGLAIAKTLVGKHGGKIRMESEVGVGGTLVIQFPVASRY